MATDDERRRVAAALREYASFDCEDEGEEECLVDCADWGERVINLLDCGDTEKECYTCLADLIEPSESVKCVAEVKVDGEKLEGLVRDAVAECAGVDREALLALADELTSMLTLEAYVNRPREYDVVSDVARRIREACGERAS